MLEVKLERIRQGYKSYEFAAMLGINPQLWSHMELARRDVPDEAAEKAAQILGKPKDQLFAPALEGVGVDD